MLRNFRGRLFRKYLVLIISLVASVVLVSGGISFRFSYLENKSALADLQHEKAIAAAARIEQYMQQIERQLTYARCRRSIPATSSCAASSS